jgi:hypothetical protein
VTRFPLPRLWEQGIPREGEDHFGLDRVSYYASLPVVPDRNSDRINPLKTKRERVRKDSVRVEVQRKHLGESERRFISEGGKEHLLEGTQATPARPSDADKMGVKTLGWWVVKA